MSTPPPLALQSQAQAAAGDPRLGKAMADLEAILVPGESIQATAVQRRLFALTHRRLILVASSGRLIALARGLFGGFQLTDVRWQDLKDVHLRAGIFGSDLNVHAFPSQDLAVQEQHAGGLLFHGLRKVDAEQIYRLCQANGQAWREKRRQRELEEMRARAGGVQIGATGAAPAATGAPADDLVARLEHAREMLQKGLITDSEYEAIKAKVLGTL
jgi:hypothetical protein